MRSGFNLAGATPATILNLELCGRPAATAVFYYDFIPSDQTCSFDLSARRPHAAPTALRHHPHAHGPTGSDGVDRRGRLRGRGHHTDSPSHAKQRMGRVWRRLCVAHGGDCRMYSSISGVLIVLVHHMRFHLWLSASDGYFLLIMISEEFGFVIFNLECLDVGRKLAKRLGCILVF